MNPQVETLIRQFEQTHAAFGAALGNDLIADAIPLPPWDTQGPMPAGANSTAVALQHSDDQQPGVIPGAGPAEDGSAAPRRTRSSRLTMPTRVTSSMGKT